MEVLMRWLAAVLVCAGLVAAGHSQQPDKDYRFQDYDQIFVSLAQEPERNIRATVGGDGYIDYPYIGRVLVRGRTVAEVQEEIVSRLKAGGYFVAPEVSITIESFRKPLATVVGQDTVQRPNAYEFRPGQRLRDLIGMAGGPIYGAADTRRAVLQRKDSNERIPVNLRFLLQDVRDDQNYELKDGDVLTVPRDEQNFITVIGEVNNPGPQAYREGMRVTDAIAAARGGIPERGRLSAITLLRKDPYDPAKVTQIPINLFDAIKDINKDLVLQKMDTLVVPRTNNIDLRNIRDLANAIYIITITLRNRPFDAVTDALR